MVRVVQEQYKHLYSFPQIRRGTTNRCPPKAKTRSSITKLDRPKTEEKKYLFAATWKLQRSKCRHFRIIDSNGNTVIPYSARLSRGSLWKIIRAHEKGLLDAAVELHRLHRERR
jgi:hypothetical protein